VEQGYQQMKEELGLAHFEGRSWRGFHHHACLVMMAYGFLALEQLRAKHDPAAPGKKGIPRRRSRSRRFVAPCSGC
jgi:SRSO17 transposase